MRVGWSVVIGVALGCNGGGSGKDATEPGPPEQGVVGMIRMPDGSPGIDALSFVGGASRTEPDSAGFVYQLDALPGRLPVSAELDGWAPVYRTPEVHPDHLSATRFDLVEITVVEVPDPSQQTVIDGDGFTLTIPPDSIEVDGKPWSEPWTLGWLRVGEPERRSQPTDLTSIRNDVDLVDIEIHEGILLRGWNADGRLVAGIDSTFQITVDVPASSPLLQSSASRLYAYSHSRAYWASAGVVLVDEDANTVTHEGFKSLNWLALGLDATERGCITGRVVDGNGAGIYGADVTLVQDGTIGVDRNTTLDGEFCLSMDVGATGTLEILGVRSDRRELYTWSGAIDGPTNVGPCVSACTDLGTISVDVHPDADGDRYFSGPGGDCDDGDSSINPNLAFGDGRFCGDGS